MQHTPKDYVTRDHRIRGYRPPSAASIESYSSNGSWFFNNIEGIYEWADFIFRIAMFGMWFYWGNWQEPEHLGNYSGMMGAFSHFLQLHLWFSQDWATAACFSLGACIIFGPFWGLPVLLAAPFALPLVFLFLVIYPFFSIILALAAAFVGLSALGIK